MLARPSYEKFGNGSVGGFADGVCEKEVGDKKVCSLKVMEVAEAGYAVSLPAVSPGKATCSEGSVSKRGAEEFARRCGRLGWPL